MELQQYLKHHPTLSSQMEVTACLNYLRCKGVVLNDNLKKLLFDHTSVEMHDYLKSKIGSYYPRRVYGTSHVTNDWNEEDDFEKGKGLSEEDWRRLKEHTKSSSSSGGTLSEKGYEYGLSDW